MVRTLFRSTLALLALSGPALVQAFEPVPGVEVMLTDVEARVLVGYGIVDARGLVLDLSTDHASLLMLVATPDGEVLSLHGELARGRVWFREDGAWVDLATLLDRASLTLRLSVDDAPAFLVGPAPGSVPPGEPRDEPRSVVARPGSGDAPGDEGDDGGDDRGGGDPSDDPSDDGSDDGRDDRSDDRSDDPPDEVDDRSDDGGHDDPDDVDDPDEHDDAPDADR